MKQTINFSQFRDEFKAIRPTNFDGEGLKLLFAYLEEYEESTGEEVELDVIALCCDYSQASPKEIADAYNLDENEDVLEFLAMNTTIVGVCDHSEIVYANF